MSRRTDLLSTGLRRLVDDGPASTITVVEQTYDLATIRQGSNSYADISTIGGLAIKDNIFALLMKAGPVTASGSASGSHWQIKFSYDDGATFSAVNYSTEKFRTTTHDTGDGTNIVQDATATTCLIEMYNLNVMAPTVGHWQTDDDNGFGTFQHIVDVVDAIRIELDWTSGGPLTSIGGTVTIYGIAIAPSKIEVETFDLTQVANQVNALVSTLTNKQHIALVVCNKAVRSGSTDLARMTVGRNGTFKAASGDYAFQNAFDNTAISNSQTFNLTQANHGFAPAQAAAIDGWTMVMNMNLNAPVWMQTYYNANPNVDNTKNQMRSLWTRADPALTASKFNQIRLDADLSGGVQTWGNTGAIYVVKVQVKADITLTALSGTSKTVLNGSKKGFACIVSAGDTPASLADAATGIRLRLGLADVFEATSYVRGLHAFNSPSKAAATSIFATVDCDTGSAAGSDHYFGARLLGLTGTVFKAAFGAAMVDHAAGSANYRCGFVTGYHGGAAAYNQVQAVVDSGAGYDGGEVYAVDYS